MNQDDWKHLLKDETLEDVLMFDTEDSGQCELLQETVHKMVERAFVIGYWRGYECRRKDGT